MSMYEVRHFLSARGRDVVADWLMEMRDTRAKVQVVKRLNRIVVGNFGDHKYCRDGVWELRINTGPGYRVYYAMAGATIVLLLCGGDKRSQSKDIERACGYFQEWQKRAET
jgi:putative addiction module killer protein